MPQYDLTLIPSWSYTLLTLFETCGWQALHTRIQKTVIEKPSQPLIDGREVHSAIEAYFTLAQPLPPSRQYLEEHILPFAQVAVLPGVKMLVEHKMCLTTQLEFTAWFGKQAWLRIATDLALVCSDHILVVDWKTGRFDQEALEQLKLNAFALFLQFPEVQWIVVSLIWVSQTHPHKPTTMLIPRAQMWDIWNSFVIRLQPLARAYATNEWRKVPGRQCSWCPVLTCELHPK